MVQIGCVGFVQEMAHGEPSLKGLSPKVGKDSSKPAWIGASKRVPLKGHRLEKRCNGVSVKVVPYGEGSTDPAK